MEKYLEYSQEILQELADKYPSCEYRFKLLELSVGISIFFVLAESSALEEDNLWQKVSEEIALKYQPKLESVYEKWNLYIIYVTSDKISKELKNKIENNKFSSRKIIEDNYSLKLDKCEEDRLIIKHITNSDLKEIVDKTTEINISKYVPINSNLWKLLDNEDKIIGDKEAQEFIVNELNKK